MDKEVIDLYSLQIMLQDGVREIMPEKYWIKAEIASIQVKTNGHCYMDLCQNINNRIVAKAKAIIWRSTYIPLAAYFKEASSGGCISAGMEMLFRVSVNYSELYGLSLIVDDIDASFTLGAYELARRQTIAKLEADGLLDKQQELQVATIPYRLAVISAKDAAGYGDFCRQLESNEQGFCFDIQLFEATMQGSSAPESIIDALQEIEMRLPRLSPRNDENKIPVIANGTKCSAAISDQEEIVSSSQAFDAILIIRGGGSTLDLSAFDDYALCFAIANCTIPVYTAIGHDRDHHIADMVAYEYVKTPTALAEIFIDCLATEDQRIESYSNRLKMAFINRLRLMENKVDMLHSRIHNADPRNILQRGYTLVTNNKGVVVKSAKQLQQGDEIRILFKDGDVNSVITNKITRDCRDLKVSQ